MALSLCFELLKVKLYISKLIYTSYFPFCNLPHIVVIYILLFAIEYKLTCFLLVILQQYRTWPLKLRHILKELLRRLLVGTAFSSVKSQVLVFLEWAEGFSRWLVQVRILQAESVECIIYGLSGNKDKEIQSILKLHSKRQQSYKKNPILFVKQRQMHFDLILFGFFLFVIHCQKI